MDSRPERIPLETVGENPPPPPAAAPPPPPPAEPVPSDELREKVVRALQGCYDPEIPVNIWELGLIYDVAVEENGSVYIKMTLTSPACPAATSLPPEVRAKVAAIPGVRDVKLDVVWDPPWNQDMMSEAARLELGLDY